MKPCATLQTTPLHHRRESVRVSGGHRINRPRVLTVSATIPYLTSVSARLAIVVMILFVVVGHLPLCHVVRLQRYHQLAVPLLIYSTPSPALRGRFSFRSLMSDMFFSDSSPTHTLFAADIVATNSPTCSSPNHHRIIDRIEFGLIGLQHVK